MTIFAGFLAKPKGDAQGLPAIVMVRMRTWG